MATLKITRRTVEAIRPASKPFIIYDSEIKGFGVRVMPSGIATYIIEYRPGEGGRGVAKKRMSLGRTNELAPDEARRLAQQHLGSVRHGEDPLLDRESKRREIKVRQLIEAWEAENPAGRKSGKPMAPRTRKNTLARLRHHVVPLLGDKRVSAVSVDDVNDMIRRVTNGETRRKDVSEHNRGRIVVTGGAGAARKVSSDLSIVFSFAVERKIITANPVTGARKPRAGKRHDYLRAEHLEAIGKALSQLEKAGANPSGIAILRLLLMTGARPSEIEGLKWSEIDFSANSLRLTDSKTGYSIRPLATAPLAILAKVQRREGSEYVFPATRGDGYYTGSKKLWNRAREVAGLPDRVRYHARHAVATLALGAGHDVASVSAIMGHKGPRTTMSTYSHVIDDRAARAAESIGGQIAVMMEGGLSANVVSLRNGKSRSKGERQ